MAQRIGIAVDLEIRKFELEQEYKNTRGWRSTSAFETMEEALEWEKKKALELKVKTVPPGKPRKNPPNRIRWYGFIFEHDGPK